MNTLRRIFLVSLLFVFSSSAFADPKLNIFVFLNGHNNLDSAGHKDIEEMVKGMQNAKNDHVRLIVQWASLENDEKDPIKGVRRIEITKDGIQEIEALGKVDMGDSKSLQAFLEWGIKKYPSEQVMVDVWDHGSGWKAPISPHIRAISLDEISGNMITTEQLSDIFNDYILTLTGGKKVIFGNDACLQAGCELSSEFRKGVRTMIASAEVEPGDGWPYDAWLKTLNETQAESLTPQFIGETLSKAYIKSYEGMTSGTLAVIDVEATEEFEKVIKKFTGMFKELPEADKKVMMEALHLSLRYQEEEYVDLGDFMNSIISRTQQGSKNQQLIQACEDINAGLKKVVKYNGTTTDMAKSSGLSIWLPESGPAFLTESERYKALSFHKGSGWGDYIYSLLYFEGRHWEDLCDIYLKNKNIFPRKRRHNNPNMQTTKSRAKPPAKKNKKSK